MQSKKSPTIILIVLMALALLATACSPSDAESRRSKLPNEAILPSIGPADDSINPEGRPSDPDGDADPHAHAHGHSHHKCVRHTHDHAGDHGDDDHGTESGSAYLFEDSGSGWTEVAKFTASDGAANDEFGWSVSNSGTTAIVGANGDDDNGTESGSAYIFSPPPPTPTPTRSDR